MSTTVMSDAMMMPAMESQPMATKPIAQTTEIECVKCDCCGLTEECTQGYMERIRERYQGKWICGLCGEAVKDEIVRSERLISTEEAMTRHIAFCRTPTSSGPPPDPTVHLIAAMRQILRRSLDSPTSLRRSLDSPTSVRSMPNSPTTNNYDNAGLTRSESCIPNLTLVDSSSCHDPEEDRECSNEMQ